MNYLTNKKTNKMAKINKEDRNWTVVQISKEAHAILKEYSDHHGFKMTALLGNLIKKNCKLDKRKSV
jgi:hypothetical protein